MADGEWEIQEVRLMGETLVLRIPAVPTLKPLPGQYFQVVAPGTEAPAAAALFLAGEQPSQWDLAGTIPPDWVPGRRLRWRGPLGRGFDLPAGASRTAFVPWRVSGLTLLPLLQQALRRKAAVTWYSRQVPGWLPPQVEVLPPESLPEVGNWADYAALICDMNHLTELRAALGLNSSDRMKCPAEVLVNTPLVCGGVGECGVCAVKTRRGWKLACKGGPVFDLDQLEV